MNGPELLKPVLDFLTTLIAEHGHILYMVLVMSRYRSLRGF
jgi:hypothetical protein